MASPRTSIHKRGFTLLELVVVIALASLIASVGLIVSMSDFRGYRYRDEREVIIGALMHARSEALTNACHSAGCSGAASHGVYFGIPHEYLVFEGDSYTARDASQDELIHARDATVSVSGLESVVFHTGSADADAVPISILSVVSGATRTDITIDANGRITD